MDFSQYQTKNSRGVYDLPDGSWSTFKPTRAEIKMNSASLDPQSGIHPSVYGDYVRERQPISTIIGRQGSTPEQMITHQQSSTPAWFDSMREKKGVPAENFRSVTNKTSGGGLMSLINNGIGSAMDGLKFLGGMGGNETAQNTISMPSMSNENVPGWINDLSQGIPNFFQAYENYQGLPGKIDEWTQNAINRQRATGEQTAGIFNQVANQRAGSGIMGGTEQSNALAQMMTNLARIYSDNRTNIDMAGAGMKANAISGLPSAAMLPIGAMSSLYGQNAADQQNWASLAANILNTGY